MEEVNRLYNEHRLHILKHFTAYCVL